ncbi:hypothetical protein [Burkholderia ubonensis]|uniref:hypothetical protein n=1 Tax=Burkholderia ubonensis TaxID=101571 RepID=UPI0012F96E7E|nr:hypothetical protein [Burkholderia ubonensis]
MEIRSTVSFGHPVATARDREIDALPQEELERGIAEGSCKKSSAQRSFQSAQSAVDRESISE